MDNQIMQKAINIVTQAITADNGGDHKTAYDLYTRALEHFMLALKCRWHVRSACGRCSVWADRGFPPLLTDETNPSAREVILKKLQGYMTRAEQLKKSLGSPTAAAADGAGGSATAESKGDSKEDGESKKMKGALAGAHACRHVVGSGDFTPHRCCVWGRLQAPS